MKAFAFAPMAVAAILAMNISTASSQGACGQKFQACMDTCAARSTKQIQDGCFSNCENNNNMCAESVLGKRPANVGASGAQLSTAKDAQARQAPAAQQPAGEQPRAETREPQQQEARGEAQAPQAQQPQAQAPQAQPQQPQVPQRTPKVRH